MFDTLEQALDFYTKMAELDNYKQKDCVINMIDILTVRVIQPNGSMTYLYARGGKWQVASTL